MSARGVGRPKKDFTDSIIKLISEKVWRHFINDGFFEVPSDDILTSSIVNDKKMRKLKVRLSDVKVVIKNYKKDLKCLVEIASRLKLKLRPRVNGNLMLQETSDILDLIVELFYDSFVDKKVPSHDRNEFLYSEIKRMAKLRGIGKFSSMEISTKARNNFQALKKRCLARRELKLFQNFVIL